MLIGINFTNTSIEFFYPNLDRVVCDYVAGMTDRYAETFVVSLK